MSDNTVTANTSEGLELASHSNSEDEHQALEVRPTEKDPVCDAQLTSQQRHGNQEPNKLSATSTKMIPAEDIKKSLATNVTGVSDGEVRGGRVIGLQYNKHDSRQDNRQYVTIQPLCKSQSASPNTADSVAADTRADLNMDVTGISGGKVRSSSVKGVQYNKHDNRKDNRQYVDMHLEQKIIEGGLKLRQTTERHIDEWTKGMVHTAATQSVLDLILQGKTWVTVTGSPGEGKTTAAYLTLQTLHGMGRHVYEIRTPDDYFKVKHSNGPVLLFNDILGSNRFSQDNLRKWRPVLTDILDTKEHREWTNLGLGTSISSIFSQNRPLTVILVCRSSVLNSATHLLGRFKDNVLETVVNLTHDMKMSAQEKLQIWEHHADMYNVSVDDKTVIHVCNMSLSHGFPHSCRLFAAMYSKNKSLSMKQFFSKPIEFLNQAMESLLDDSKTGPLLREMLKRDGCLQLNSIDDDVWQHQYKPVAERLKGTYISEENGSVRFHHNSVYDSAAFVVCNIDPLFVIRHCSLSFLNERVRFQALQHQDMERLLTITIPSKYINTYIQRLKTELSGDNINLVLSHASFYDQDFVEKFIKTIYSDSQAVSETDFIHDFICRIDKETRQSFLFYSSSSRSDKILKYICNHVQLSQCEQIEAIFGICEHSSVSSLLFLLSQYENIPLNERDLKYLTPLLVSSKKSSCEILKLLIEKGADVTARDRGGNSVLYNICENGVDGDGDVVTMVIDKNAEFNWKSENYLLTAAKEGHENVVKTLIYKGANVNETDNRSSSSLHYACSRGYSDIMRILIDNGAADMNIADKHGIKPFHCACFGGHLNIMTTILQKGFDISNTDLNGRTALHLASLHGHVKIMTALLDRGININHTDKNGVTAFHCACHGGHVYIMRVLLDNGADTNQTDKDGNTALHFACRGGNVNAMVLLLDRGIDFHQINKTGISAFLCACIGGHFNVMKALLDRGVAIKQTAKDGKTALHHASRGGHVKILEALIERGIDINQRDNDGITAFLCACHGGHVDVVTALLDTGVDINQTAKDCHTALHIACRKGHVNLMASLLENGVDMKRADQNGVTAFLWASIGGHVDVTRALLERGVDIKQADKGGTTALHYACVNGHIDVLTELLDRGALINQANKDGRTAVHNACRGGHGNVITVLKERGADVNQKAQDGNTCLHFACKGGHVGVVAVLLELEVDINQRDKNGITAFHCACQGGHVLAMTALLDKGVDINQTATNGCTALHYSCLEGHVSVVTALLNRGADINHPDKKGSTALHFACVEGHFDVITSLLDIGADVNHTDSNDSTAFFYACRGGYLKVMSALFDRGVIINQKNRNGRTVIHSACGEGNINVVTSLLDMGVDINQTDNNCGTALQYACLGGHVNVVLALIDKGVDVNQTDKYRRTVLQSACYKGHLNVVSVLLDMGTDINQTDMDGSTALHYACRGGQTDVLTVLLKKGMDINEPEKNGSAALHTACLRGLVNIMTVLLDRGADINQIDKDGCAVLHFACKGGHVKVMTSLLDMGVDINQADNNGSTPLHYACLFRKVNAVKTLLARGADIFIADFDGNTSLHNTCIKNDIDVAKVLLAHMDVTTVVRYVNMTNKNSKTPLCLVCDDLRGDGSKDNDNELYRYLIENGAKVDEITHGSSVDRPAKV